MIGRVAPTSKIEEKKDEVGKSLYFSQLNPAGCDKVPPFFVFQKSEIGGCYLAALVIIRLEMTQAYHEMKAKRKLEKC